MAGDKHLRLMWGTFSQTFSPVRSSEITTNSSTRRGVVVLNQSGGGGAWRKRNKSGLLLHVEWQVASLHDAAYCKLAWQLIRNDLRLYTNRTDVKYDKGEQLEQW